MAPSLLPTADWVELSPVRGDLAGEPREPGGEVAGTRYILKAIGEHASFGMDEKCVVAPANREQLQTLLAEFESRHQRPAFAERYIEGREFNVALLAGPNGPEALRICEERKDEIHLLVTDMVMPSMDGTELARFVRQTRPRIKVLFMSGYTDREVAGEDLWKREAAFIQKPFTVDDLNRKVRDVLGTRK